MPGHSDRFAALPPYPLADVPALKRDLRARGVDLIDLGVGDADLPPPPAAVDAIRAAAADPANSRYSFQLGLPAFREEIAGWTASRFGVDGDPVSGLLPIIGSKEGIFHLPFAFLDPGDVAIILTLVISRTSAGPSSPAASRISCRSVRRTISSSRWMPCRTMSSAVQSCST
jgi:LL-diaminopimelate aminotransferase